MSDFAVALVTLVIAVAWFVVAYLTRKTNPGTKKLATIGGIVAVIMTFALALIVALQIRITAAVAVPLFVATVYEFAG